MDAGPLVHAASDALRETADTFDADVRSFVSKVQGLAQESAIP